MGCQDGDQGVFRQRAGSMNVRHEPFPELRDTVETFVRLMKRTLGETITTETLLADDLWPGP